jgi:hypothetical protein
VSGQWLADPLPEQRAEFGTLGSINRHKNMSPGQRLAAWLAAAAAILVAGMGGLRVEAGGGITPGVAAGGVPLNARVEAVERILGRPTDELRDPTNRAIIIQRWEPLCLGARFTAQGELLALDAWFDLGHVCPAAGARYSVQGRGTESIAFSSTRQDVKRIFGYRPERVLHAPRFTVLVYDTAGVAFYIRQGREIDQSGGDRDGRVDVITVFPPAASTNVWAPAAWGHR